MICTPHCMNQNVLGPLSWLKQQLTGRGTQNAKVYDEAISSITLQQLA